MSDSITNQVASNLNTEILKEVKTLNTGIPAPILKQAIEKVIENAAPQLVNDVNTTANHQLNNIPKTAIGPINPVNITNGNLGPSDITNNLNGIVQTNVSDSSSSNITNQIQNQLKLSLPANKLNQLNFSSLNSTLLGVINPLINKNIKTALGGFSTQIFNQGNTQNFTVPNVETLYENLTPEQAQTEIDKVFENSLANNALKEAKNFNVDNSNNQEKLVAVSTGFIDPQANYPTKEYSGISDTNKLATGDPTGTIVLKKNKERMFGARLPFGEAWDQPDSPYRGQYPYNKVTQTEQGHIIEVDDTPGSERLHVYHKSGTFIEIDANGSVVKRTKGSSYEIIDKNGKISITGRADISINGACNIFVGNDANIEVEGDTNITCHNDITAQAGGTLNLSATEEINITSGNVNIQAYYRMNQKAEDFNIHSSNVIQMHSNADIKVQGVDWFFYSDNLFVETANDIHHKAGGSSYVSVGTDINQVAGGSIYNDVGGEFHMASGNATEAASSDTSYIADSSNIGVLTGRKTTQYFTINDPQTLSLADNRSLLLEEETASSSDLQNQKNLIISQGFSDASSLDKPPLSLENESVSSVQNDFVDPDIKLKSVTALPGNYNLSPNFTLEMLSNKAAVSKDSVRAHGNLKYGDIVYNLQGIALNVLEPVLKLYPNMFVTSAFRDPGNASNAKTSQHPLGQGVDIQFKGANKVEYYNIAKVLARVLRYDQLILEYCEYTKNPWIHVSYSVEKNRIQVLTFFNHRKHSDGLSNLA